MSSNVCISFSSHLLHCYRNSCPTLDKSKAFLKLSVLFFAFGFQFFGGKKKGRLWGFFFYVLGFFCLCVWFLCVCACLFVFWKCFILVLYIIFLNVKIYRQIHIGDFYTEL